jgi:ipoprotein LpqH
MEVPVRGRFVAAAVTASVLVASCSGCFLRAEKVPQKTARVTVNNNTRTSHAVSCSQVEWMLTADISAAPARVKVALKLDSEKPKVESVNIDNFAGFTGVADVGAGNAAVVFAGDKYTITGKAEGSQRDDPRISTTAPFKIEVGC